MVWRLLVGVGVSLALMNVMPDSDSEVDEADMPLRTPPPQRNIENPV